MKEGKLFRSNGKYEPKHWEHFVVEDYGTHAKTVTNNNNWGSIENYDGYEEIEVDEYYCSTKREIIAEYLYDAFIGKAELKIWEESDQAMKNVVENIVKLFK